MNWEAWAMQVVEEAPIAPEEFGRLADRIGRLAREYATPDQVRVVIVGLTGAGMQLVRAVQILEACDAANIPVENAFEGDRPYALYGEPTIPDAYQLK